MYMHNVYMCRYMYNIYIYISEAVKLWHNNIACLTIISSISTWSRIGLTRLPADCIHWISLVNDPITYDPSAWFSTQCEKWIYLSMMELWWTMMKYEGFSKLRGTPIHVFLSPFWGPLSHGFPHLPFLPVSLAIASGGTIEWSKSPIDHGVVVCLQIFPQPVGNH